LPPHGKDYRTLHGERIQAATRTGGRDWTRGSIFHNLLSLSWPMMVNQSLNMLGPTVDIIWLADWARQLLRELE